MSLCAVIPAAGRGHRLGVDQPKLLVPITEQLTIWDILKQKLIGLCDHIVIVMSPWGEPFLQERLANDPDREKVSIVIQKEPVGMGDAIMQGQSIWKDFDNISIIWGDQVHVSTQTLLRCRDAQLSVPEPSCTIPLVSLQVPYVEYCFDSNNKLQKILQSREGDQCSRGGFGDVGTFFLSTSTLYQTWQAYVAAAERGVVTNEVNFLPFLVYLAEQGWNFSSVLVDDPDEAKGINTQDELAYFCNLYSAR